MTVSASNCSTITLPAKSGPTQANTTGLADSISAVPVGSTLATIPKHLPTPTSSHDTRDNHHANNDFVVLVIMLVRTINKLHKHAERRNLTKPNATEVLQPQIDLRIRKIRVGGVYPIRHH